MDQAEKAFQGRPNLGPLQPLTPSAALASPASLQNLTHTIVNPAPATGVTAVRTILRRYSTLCDAGTRTSKFRCSGSERRLTHAFFHLLPHLLQALPGASLPISTVFTESAVNEIVAKRRNKNQPLRWNRYPARAVLDGTGSCAGGGALEGPSVPCHVPFWPDLWYGPRRHVRK